MTRGSHRLRALLATAFFLEWVAFPAAADTPAPSASSPGIGAELGLKESDRPLRDLFKDWRAPRKVMINVGGDPSRLAFMKEAAPAGVMLIPVSSKEEALPKVGDVDAIIAPWGCSADVVAAAKRLRWVQVGSAGVERCALEQLRRQNVVLTNLQRVRSAEIAEHVIGLTLALARGLDGAMNLQRQGKWEEGDMVPPGRLWSLEGRTVLVAGLGGIGTRVAEKAHALGMRVIATRNSTREGPSFVEYVGLSDELPKLVERADVVVNALPHTPQTKGVFNAAMFERMQKHAYYISVGRGATTVTDDLVAALKNSTIGGAGLDVTDPEPLPEGHPLWSAPNVIITPHMAPAGENAGTDRAWELNREQLRRFVAGDKLYSVVDLSRGY